MSTFSTFPIASNGRAYAGFGRLSKTGDAIAGLSLAFSAICILALLFVQSTSVSAEEIYKWVDNNGKVHYGDSLPANAHRQEIKAEVNSLDKQSFEYHPVAKAVPPPKVIMYATSWCPYCRKARAYFKSKGIRYEEYDIEKSADAKRRYDALGGNGVPLILVDGQKLAGFSPERFDVLYSQ